MLWEIGLQIYEVDSWILFFFPKAYIKIVHSAELYALMERKVQYTLFSSPSGKLEIRVCYCY